MSWKHLSAHTLDQLILRLVKIKYCNGTLVDRDLNRCNFRYLAFNKLCFSDFCEKFTGFAKMLITEMYSFFVCSVCSEGFCVYV